MPVLCAGLRRHGQLPTTGGHTRRSRWGGRRGGRSPRRGERLDGRAAGCVRRRPPRRSRRDGAGHGVLGSGRQRRRGKRPASDGNSRGGAGCPRAPQRIHDPARRQRERDGDDRRAVRDRAAARAVPQPNARVRRATGRTRPSVQPDVRCLVQPLLLHAGWQPIQHGADGDFHPDHVVYEPGQSRIYPNGADAPIRSAGCHVPNGS